MQQTFWLVGRSVYDTIQPAVMERRNAICPQLFETPDLTEIASPGGDENDEVFEVGIFHTFFFCILNCVLLQYYGTSYGYVIYF